MHLEENAYVESGGYLHKDDI